ncbi:MAG: hypothetical protein H0V09_10585 [Gemmatimonadetes bacterium]|nr:hypothetical protein [Gemmatimonadota bacterium]
MPRFLGQYLHAIDDKGRVPLPAKLRNGGLDGSGNGVEAGGFYVAVRGTGGCLFLYQEEAFTVVLERLARLRRNGDPESRRRALAVTAQAAELVLDKHGRLTLPQNLLDVAGLQREALFVGAADVIEIWNPGRFGDAMRVEDDEYDRFAATVL